MTNWPGHLNLQLSEEGVARMGACHAWEGTIAMGWCICLHCYHSPQRYHQFFMKETKCRTNASHWNSHLGLNDIFKISCHVQKKKNPKTTHSLKIILPIPGLKASRFQQVFLATLRDYVKLTLSSNQYLTHSEVASWKAHLIKY